ncbi:hypothetical protein GRJ2_002008200 [Grus japonensis]|uniref:Uncharacterized protein n=1 Tax=Grus japonensis TaxID=30415 RepID=A0ABC9XEF6_GRUJA
MCDQAAEWQIRYQTPRRKSPAILLPWDHQAASPSGPSIAFCQTLLARWKEQSRGAGAHGLKMSCGNLAARRRTSLP